MRSEDKTTPGTEQSGCCPEAVKAVTHVTDGVVTNGDITDDTIRNECVINDTTANEDSELRLGYVELGLQN